MSVNEAKTAILNNKTALGIEFGSTRIKAVLVDDKYAPIASGSYDWENRYENGIWTYSLEDIHKGLQGSYSRGEAHEGSDLDPVLVLDDPFSALDRRTEDAVFANLQAYAKDKVVLLISHRLANVTASDEIYVLERGNIVQHGTHEALLKQGGAYAALWSAQQVLEHYGEEAAK